MKIGQSCVILLITLVIFSWSCQSSDKEIQSVNSEARTDTTQIVEEIQNDIKDNKPFLKIDSSEIRISSELRMKQLYLHTKLYFSSNVENIIYAVVSIEYKDKYDKVWFKESVKVKDIDCNFSGLCELDYSIPYSSNTHKYYSDRVGTSISTFDLVLMNSNDFKFFNTEESYKGKPVNLNVKYERGFERVLIPDPIVEVVKFK